MKLLPFLLCFLVLSAHGESSQGTSSATARITLSITVLPTFKILKTEVRGNVTDYTVWTNMKSAMMGDTLVQFPYVGQHVVTLPTSSVVTVVSP